MNIVFTVEEYPGHFLDTAFTYDNNFNCRVTLRAKIPSIFLEKSKRGKDLC